MKTRLALFALTVIVVAACHTTKKTTSSKAETTAATTTVSPTPTVASTPTTTVVKSVKTADGVYEPGEEELAAIQPQYKDATLAQLKEGYTLYAKSACISCHGTVNIYSYPKEKWFFIIPDMAYRAKLTPEQKESVFRYVSSIVAANPNQK